MSLSWDDIRKGWTSEIATDAELSQYCEPYYQELIAKEEDEPKVKS